MADSDAEELSVGAPSPVPNQDNHQQFNNYREADDGCSSGFSTQSSQPRNAVTRGESSSASQRHPTCALCKNHQQISSLKKHKRYCPYRKCRCQLCYETNKKRDINAKQVASRRSQAQDEELVKKGILPSFQRSTDSPQPSTSSASGKVRNQEYKNRGEDSPELVNSGSNDPLHRTKPESLQNPPSRLAFFSPQLSLRSFQISQKITELLKFVREDSTLTQEQLGDLYNKVNDLIKETTNASDQLSEIELEIQRRITLMHPYRVNPPHPQVQNVLSLNDPYNIPSKSPDNSKSPQNSPTNP